MLLKFPYGKGLVQAEIPDKQLEVATSHPTEPLANLGETVKQGIRKPIHCKPLHRLLGRGDKVCVIVPDETRACPTKEILHVVLDELETCRVGELEILIGNGLHRGMSNREMAHSLGIMVVEEYNVVNHSACDDRQLVDLGVKTSYGTPAIVNIAAAKTDHLLGIGLVEPHFFAGFSGGRKTVLPAVAGKEAIFNNHSHKMLSHPNSSYGILDGNPIHLDMIEFMRVVNLSLIINVTRNSEGKITQVFPGHPIKAHRRAVDFLNRCVKTKFRDYADVVITSNGGYPMDRDLYQSVKGIAVAERIVKEKGVIIVVAECIDGLGEHEEFKRLMQEADSPEQVLEEIEENEPFPDQWQAQILARVLKKAKVIVVTEGVNHEVIGEMMMNPASTVEQALDFATKRESRKKLRIAAIPEGPHIIPFV